MDEERILGDVTLMKEVSSDMSNHYEGSNIIEEKKLDLENEIKNNESIHKNTVIASSVAAIDDVPSIQEMHSGNEYQYFKSIKDTITDTNIKILKTSITPQPIQTETVAPTTMLLPTAPVELVVAPTNDTTTATNDNNVKQVSSSKTTMENIRVA